MRRTPIAALILTLTVSSPVLGKDDIDTQKWKPEWSKALLESLSSSQADNLLSKTSQLTDLNDFCPTPPKSEAEKKLFWLEMFKALAGPESTYDPNAEGKGPNGIPVGLLQMGAADAGFYGCSKKVSKEKYMDAFDKLKAERKKSQPDKAKVAELETKIKEFHALITPELKDPALNLNCAVRIANAGCGDKNTSSIAGGEEGKKGVLGCFWQAVRKGTTKWDGKTFDNQKKRDKIINTVSRTCNAAFGNGGNLADGFTADERKWAGLSTPMKKENISEVEESIATVEKVNSGNEKKDCGKINLFDYFTGAASHCITGRNKLNDPTADKVKTDHEPINHFLSNGGST